MFAKLTGIRGRMLALLPKAGDLPGGAQDRYVLERTATDYLLTSVRYYLSLPADYATTQVVQDGKTPLKVRHDQLDLPDGQMAEIGMRSTSASRTGCWPRAGSWRSASAGRTASWNLPKR